MTVAVVTDSSSCLPAKLAQQAGITVLDVHVTATEEQVTTAGLTSLELVKAYSRQQALHGDDGVLALHMAKDLSSTWAAATAAAAVFEPHEIQVADTHTVGPALGVAALVAADAAKRGEDLASCAKLAAAVCAGSHMVAYVHNAAQLRKSGRMRPGAVLVAQALAAQPILSYQDGRIDVVGKVRTESKALARLQQLVANFQLEAAGRDDATGQPLVVLGFYQAEELAGKLQAQLQETDPELAVAVLPLDAALAVHLGPGALVVSYLPHCPQGVIESLTG